MAPNEQIIREHLTKALAGVDEPKPSYRGKVRDVFEKGDELLLVATDRISAFDVVLGTVPLKGQLLTEQAAFWLEKASAVVPTHLVERVDAQAMRCKKAQALPVELVVRGFLAGSLMREPKESRGKAYGLTLDPTLADYARFDTPLVTPTTKEAVGVHDQPCSLDDLVTKGSVSRANLEKVVAAALALFALGQKHAEAHGLLLVDTKYEFGLDAKGAVILIDEVHTADSSRFWVKDTYASNISAGTPPDMLDKERLRRWLIGQGFSGNGTPPALSDDVKVDLASHYWDLTERVLGKPFAPVTGDAAARVTGVVRRFVG